MQDKFKTKEQLLNELAELRQHIAEMEQSQSNLKEAEEKYRNIFENCIEGIYQTILEGRFIGANPSAARLLGYESPADLINSVTDIGTQVYAYPEDREKAIRSLKEHGAFENFEMQYRKKDGNIAWGLHNSRLVQDDQGNILYIEGTIQDITERKQMEEVLRESEEKYRSLVEHAYDAIMIADLGGNLLEVNEKTEKLLGYTKDELLDTNISQIHPGEELGRVLRTFRDMVEGKTGSLLDTKVLRKDGKTVPIDISGGIITYGGRQVAQGIFRDITERKEIEQHLLDYQKLLEKLVEERTAELKESEEKYRDIFEDAVVGIYQSTPEGRFLMVNSALAQVYGYESPEELVQSVTDIATQIYAEPERRKLFMAAIKKNEIVRNFEIQARSKDGLIKHMSINAHTVKDGNGDVLYYEGIIQDITDRKVAEKALEFERQALQEANTALKVLLKHREADRKELEEKLLANVRQLVMPYVDKLKKRLLDPVQKMTINVIESNLNELISPFLNSIQDFKSTPRQLEVSPHPGGTSNKGHSERSEHEQRGCRHTKIPDTKEARSQ